MFGTALFSLLLSWVQVSSETFIVKSSAGEDRAVRVLKELEGFRQLIKSTLVFRDTQLPELPIEVLLIGDAETLNELEPEYNGRKLAVAGFYQAGQDRDFIVLSGRVYADNLTNVVYHELTHYFVGRGLASRPAWLNEGLAEYFSEAEIRENSVSLGAVSPQRLQFLKSANPLPLKEFFAVDSASPFYNESSKAGMFYAQAWAFIHYMLHGEHAPRFKQYLSALQKGDADLLAHLQVSQRQLEIGFQSYLNVFLPRAPRTIVKVPSEEWAMEMDAIPETEAQMSIAEIFLANGKIPEARRHLEILSAQAPDSTRVSYYRGVLARIAGDASAREFFVDALLDPFLAPRAAVQLAGMGERGIPAVRAILEEAAANRTRTPEVYLALADIHAEEIHRIQETVRLQREKASLDVPLAAAAAPNAAPAGSWTTYMQGSARNIGYELLAESEGAPRVMRVTVPYYPQELIAEKVGGDVVLELQITEQGKVGGIWLISASPEYFANLATASLADWEFEPIAAKVRLVLRFKP